MRHARALSVMPRAHVIVHALMVQPCSVRPTGPYARRVSAATRRGMLFSRQAIGGDAPSCPASSAQRLNAACVGIRHDSLPYAAEARRLSLPRSSPTRALHLFLRWSRFDRGSARRGPRVLHLTHHLTPRTLHPVAHMASPTTCTLHATLHPAPAPRLASVRNVHLASYILHRVHLTRLTRLTLLAHLPYTLQLT